MAPGFHNAAMHIRTATTDDAAAVQAIYAPIVRDTSISFETEPPAVDEMRRRISSTLVQYPWLVALDAEDAVCGYVYASRYAERQAYRWSATVTAYVRADQRGRGVGRALYAELLRQLTTLGYCQAYAGITLPNDASVALHEAVGFTCVGVFANAGHKLGRWYDVGWWQCALQRPDPPPEPRPFSG
jgi:phosphinothricin acetyltransferase